MQDRVSNINMFCSSISLANGLVVLFSIRKRKTKKYSEQETKKQLRTVNNYKATYYITNPNDSDFYYFAMFYDTYFLEPSSPWWY